MLAISRKWRRHLLSLSRISIEISPPVSLLIMTGLKYFWNDYIWKEFASFYNHLLSNFSMNSAEMADLFPSEIRPNTQLLLSCKLWTWVMNWSSCPKTWHKDKKKLKQNVVRNIVDSQRTTTEFQTHNLSENKMEILDVTCGIKLMQLIVITFFINLVEIHC